MIDRVEIRHGRKPQNCRWNFDDICHSSCRYISISGLGCHVAIFVVGRCRNHFGGLSMNSSWSKTPELPLKYRRYLL